MLCRIYQWPPSLFADISRLLFFLRLQTHQGFQSKARIRGGGSGINFECWVPRLTLHIRPPIFGQDLILEPSSQYSRAFPNNQTKSFQYVEENAIPVFNAMPSQPIIDLGVPSIAVDPVDPDRQGRSRSSPSAPEQTQDAEKRDVPPARAEASHRWTQFEDARDLVRKQGFLLRSHFWAWKERPRDIPYNPDKMYKLVGWAGTAI